MQSQKRFRSSRMPSIEMSKKGWAVMRSFFGVGLAAVMLSSGVVFAKIEASWTDEWKEADSAAQISTRRRKYGEAAKHLKDFESKWVMELDSDLFCRDSVKGDFSPRKCKTLLIQKLREVNSTWRALEEKQSRIDAKIAEQKPRKTSRLYLERAAREKAETTVELEMQMEKDPRLAAFLNAYFPARLEVKASGIAGQPGLYLERAVYSAFKDSRLSLSEGDAKSIVQVTLKVGKKHVSPLNKNLLSYETETIIKIIDVSGNVILTAPHNSRIMGFGETSAARDLQYRGGRVLSALIDELIARSETGRL